MALLRIVLITIFPDMPSGFLGNSIINKAIDKGLVEFLFVNPRDFSNDKHRTTDDKPYGGGAGMVMKPEPLFKAVESVRKAESKVILMTPQGQKFNQGLAMHLAKEKDLIFICGHYEGVDERVRDFLVTDELSIGDFILTNGVLAATVIADSIVRLLPGAIGAGEEGITQESFVNGLLEYPQYTRPADFRGMKVPEVLLSGDHEKIAKWKQEQSLIRTKRRRPDILLS